MISRIARIFLFSFAVIVVIAPSIFAQFTISGTVRDPSNSPVAQVDVFLYTEQGDPIGGIDPGSSDIAGFYVLGSGGQIPSGTYNVGFEPPSNTGLIAKMIPGVAVSGSTTLNVNLEIGIHLTGFVRDINGIGISGIDLNAYYESNGQAITLNNDNTGPGGSYDVLIPAGLLRIVYRPVQGEPLVPVELRNVNITGDTVINIVLQPGFLISGTVTGPGGVPVVGADIDADNSVTGERIYTPGDNTNISGLYQVMVPVGTFDVNVEPIISSHLVPEIVFNIPVSGNTIVNFALGAGYILSGTVRNPSANPVAGADTDARIPATGARLYTPSDNTDAAGFYQVIVPPGIYDIDFKPATTAPYLAPIRVRNITMTADRTLDATVPAGRLVSGQVVSFRGTGLANVNLDAKDSLGLDVPLVGDNTAAGGNFAMVMAPALYDVEIEPSFFSGFPPDLINDMRVRIDTSIIVVLDTGLVVSGTVRDSTGAPFANVSAIARRSDTNAERFTPGNRTDVNGFYRIVIPPNTYDLVYKPDPSTGVSDTVVLADVSVMANLILDVNFHTHSGDTLLPSVTVLSPNGGEELAAFDVVPITWSATDNVGVTAVDIYYSTSGPAGPFTAIAVNEINDGQYLWEIPTEPTSDGRIKTVARDAAYNASQDLSDSSFSIVYSPFCCGGHKGDVNGNGQANGIDVVYFVAYLKGGTPPRDTCLCSDQGRIMALADANGSCSVNGIDVTYMVGFFKGGPDLRCCPSCPPVILSNEGRDSDF
jgi:hypothetical protein